METAMVVFLYVLALLVISIFMGYIGILIMVYRIKKRAKKKFTELGEKGINHLVKKLDEKFVK